MKPLSGVTVLDLTRYLTGPYCTLLLGGLGAEVLRIEAPPGQERFRNRGPFGGPRGVSMERQTPDDLGMNVLHRGRNKKSITLNLRHPEGVRMFKGLCCHVDLVVENFSPGVLDKMGIPYPVLRDLNPRLILCSISGFGQSGPLREWRAYDSVIQAMSGISSVTGFADRPPVRCGAAISDTTAPLFAIIGILAALRQREQTGRGEWVDIAMLDTSLFHLPEIFEFFLGGIEAQRRGNDHVGGTPFNTFATRDGHVTIAVMTDSDWQSFTTAIGREDLRDDERFRTHQARRQHITALEALIQAWMQSHSRAEVVDLLQRHHVAAGAVMTLAEVVDSPQLQARHMLVDLEHPTQGTLSGVKGFGMPIRFVDRPFGFDQPGALHGAHNEEIYGRLLGLEAPALQELQSQGVI